MLVISVTSYYDIEKPSPDVISNTRPFIVAVSTYWVTQIVKCDIRDYR